jgi:hypothetical protein
MAIEDKDLAGLSEQERAALSEVTDDEATLRAIADKKLPEGSDTVAGGAAAAGEDKEGGEDDEAQPGDGKADKTDAEKAQAAADAAAAATAAAATAEAAKGAEKGTEAAAAAPAAAPAADQPIVFTATAPEDAAEQVKTLRAEKAAEFKRLMDGEITPEQYSAKEDEILGKITDIDRAVTKAETAADFTVQQAQRSYLGKVNATLDAAKKEDGIDYRAPENKHLHEDLDRTVKFLANDPSNADKPEQWFLDKAHSMVKAMHGLGKAAPAGGAGAAAAAGAGAAAAAAQTRSGKGPNLDGLPPSLRNVPAAAGSDDGGEFAHLNTLTGMALERAIAKMTPEQQQRWAEAD